MNLADSYRKIQKKNYDSLWIKKTSDPSRRSRGKGISKTRGRRFLDKIINNDYIDYGN
jgi:hypothetical protein